MRDRRYGFRLLFLALIFGTLVGVETVALANYKVACRRAGGKYYEKGNSIVCVCPPLSKHTPDQKVGGRRILFDSSNRIIKPSTSVVTAIKGTALRCPSTLLEEIEVECARPDVNCHVERRHNGKQENYDPNCVDPNDPQSSLKAAADIQLEVAQATLGKQKMGVRETLNEILGAKNIAAVKMAYIYDGEDEDHAYDYANNKMVKVADGAGVARPKGDALGPFQVVFENGHLMHCTLGVPPQCAGGKLVPFSTLNSSIVSQGKTVPSQKGIYVLTDKGLFVSTYQELGKFHHTSLAGGGEVLGAGEISIDDQGRVLGLNNRSGHYLPGRLQLKQTLLYLRTKGVNIANGGVTLDEIYPDGEEIAITKLESGGTDPVNPKGPKPLSMQSFGRHHSERSVKAIATTPDLAKSKEANLAGGPGVKDTGIDPKIEEERVAKSEALIVAAERAGVAAHYSAPIYSAAEAAKAKREGSQQLSEVQSTEGKGQTERAIQGYGNFKGFQGGGYASNNSVFQGSTSSYPSSSISHDAQYASLAGKRGKPKLVSRNGLRVGVPMRMLNENTFVLPEKFGDKIEPVRLAKLDVLRAFEDLSSRQKGGLSLGLRIRGMPVNEGVKYGFIENACEFYQNETEPKVKEADFLVVKERFKKVCKELRE